MDCRKAEDLILTDYCDGELQGKSLKELEGHLMVCRSCRSFYERSAKVDQLLRGGVAPNPPEGIWVAVRERIDVEQPSVGDRLLGGLGLLFGEPRRQSFSATLATGVLILGVALPMVFLSTVSHKREVTVSEATLASLGVFLSVDEELWAESVEHFLL